MTQHLLGICGRLAVWGAFAVADDRDANARHHDKSTRKRLEYWMTTVTKPRPTLQRRLVYFSSMMLGVGVMLLAVRQDATSDDKIATIAGLGFVVLGIVLLVLAGGLDLYGRWSGRRELEPKSDKPQQTDLNELTDTERALIRLLRTSDAPPDIVAEAVREVLERRMGR